MPRDIKLGLRIDVDGKQVKGFVSASERDWKKFRGQLGRVEKDAERVGGSILGIHRRVAAYAGGVLGVAVHPRACGEHSRQF